MKLTSRLEMSWRLLKEEEEEEEVAGRGRAAAR